MRHAAKPGMTVPAGDHEGQQVLLAAAIAANPHCAQLGAAASRPFLAESLVPRRLGDVSRFLSPAWPRMRYFKRPDAERSSCHWGQLKLFECELKCLTDVLLVEPRQADVQDADARPLVVYVGAAPGRHVPSIVRRFPACRFELYDPAEFDERLVEFAASPQAEGRVTLVRGFFDEAAAQALATRAGDAAFGGPLVFFSDIRTADEKLMEEAEVEKSIKRDMERQRAWVETLWPQAALLKFRLPWGPGTTRYLRGRLLAQAFPPCTSTEARLLVRRGDLAPGGREAVYDHEEYEEQLMHHNTVARAQLHELDVPLGAVPGLDRCYDCAALATTVRRFVAGRRRVEASTPSGEEVAAEIAAILEEIGDPGGRTLATPYHVSSSRHAGRQFARRRYVDGSGQDCFAVAGPRAAKKRRRGGAAPGEAAAAASAPGEAREAKE